MRSNASTFRAFARLEENMMRLAMPKVSAADPAPLRGFPTSAPKAVKVLTATIEQSIAAKVQQ